MNRILIVEDEPDIQELLSAYLQQAGYQTSLAGDGVEALELFRSASFDLVLLDIMLPKIDGFGVCELIRQESQVPILMLTALDGEAEQLRGFDLEIDDYVTKPFSMPVLLKKIAAILRRAGGVSTAPSLLRYGDLTLDPEAMEVRLAGRSLELTARGCLPGKFCWPSCGATTFSGTSGWWTATSRISVTSWASTASRQ